jgi:hypothetical protein
MAFHEAVGSVDLSDPVAFGVAEVTRCRRRATSHSPPFWTLEENNDSEGRGAHTESDPAIP